MDSSISDHMVMDILDNIIETKADCMGLICPTCFDEFDTGQLILGRKYKRKFDVPIIYAFQLLGLAQGLKPEEVGLHLHKVKFEGFFQKAAS